MLEGPLQCAQADGERVQWVRALPARDIHVPAKDGTRLYKSTPEMLAQIAQETRRFLANQRQYAQEAGTATPYLPPVLTEHTFSDQRHGDVIDAKLAAPEGASLALYLKVRWTKRAFARVQADELRYGSIRVVPEYVDSHGETYGPLVNEFSVTDRPVVGDLGAFQDTVNLRLARIDLTAMSAEERAKMKELFQSIFRMIEELSARLGQLEEMAAEGDDAPEDEEVEAGMDEDEEMAASREGDEAESAAEPDTPAEQPEQDKEPEWVAGFLEAAQALTEELRASRYPATNPHEPPPEPSASKPTSLTEAVKLAKREGLKGTAAIERGQALLDAS